MKSLEEIRQLLYDAYHSRDWGQVWAVHQLITSYLKHSDKPTEQQSMGDEPV
jgi:hypothetical protein